MKIITDHKWRNFVYGYELTPAEREEFDYMEDIDSANFMRYKRRVYSLSGEIMTIAKDSPLAAFGFDGYAGDSFFSGILIKLSDDGEQFQIATYLS